MHKVSTVSEFVKLFLDSCPRKSDLIKRRCNLRFRAKSQPVVRKSIEHSAVGEISSMNSLLENILDAERFADIIRSEADGSPKMVSLFRDCSLASLNQFRDQWFWSIPLNLACLNQHLNLNSFALIGGNVNEAHSKTGMTPISMSACRGNVSTVKVLITLGADPAIVDAQGMTALHWASLCRQIEVLKYLCDLRKDLVNCQDLNGDTPLHIAARNMCRDSCRILHQIGGADMSIVNHEGSDPLEVAWKRETEQEWFNALRRFDEELMVKVGINEETSEESDDSLLWNVFTHDSGVLPYLIHNEMSPPHSNVVRGPCDIGKTLEIFHFASQQILRACKMMSKAPAICVIRESYANGGCVNIKDRRTGISAFSYARLRGENQIMDTLKKLGVLTEDFE
jgi:hypothetical protein